MITVPTDNDKAIPVVFHSILYTSFDEYVGGMERIYLNGYRTSLSIGMIVASSSALN